MGKKERHGSEGVTMSDLATMTAADRMAVMQLVKVSRCAYQLFSLFLLFSCVHIYW